ncbi:MAG: hypothetical protein QNJ30_06040 [Kiloniellales bacterium]|nr:hypothetical protein [Kiloniellales bacterium]
MTTSVEALVLQLLTAINAIAGLPLPERPPEVVFVSQSYLESQACDRPCEIRGWFPPGRVVYLDDRLDPQNDTWERSILVHELVHYLQQEEGTFTEDGTCETWMKREAEAYEIQYRWLVAQEVSPRLLRRTRRSFFRIDCQE